MVDSRHVTTLDILPTIADVLGIKIPWHIDGSSALSGGAGSSVVDVAGVRAPYPAALAQRRASLARELSLFGSGDWGPRFSGTGPYRGLVGRSVSTLAVVTAPGCRRARGRGRQPAPAAVPTRLGARALPLAGTLSGVRRDRRSRSR